MFTENVQYQNSNLMFALKNSENLNFPALLPNGLWLSTKNAGKFNFQNSHSEHPHEYSIKLGKKSQTKIIKIGSHQRLGNFKQYDGGATEGCTPTYTCTCVVVHIGF